MDKTIINILTVLISGSGLFVVLTKFNVPQINQTFLGTNPFLIKRDKIEVVMTWVFTLLAIIGLLLQVYSEIFGASIQERRIHTQHFYTNFTIFSLVGVAITIFVLTKIGRYIARRILKPILVENQKEVYEKAKFIVENDGWTKEQLPHKETYKGPKNYIEKNFNTAKRHVDQIENLLDLKCDNLNLKQRVERLSSYFEIINFKKHNRDSPANRLKPSADLHVGG